MSTRIGIHSGLMSLGHIGAIDHFEYRAVGDIINTAARMEGLNKYLGTKVLVSDAVLDQLEGFLCRDLGIFLFAGKSKPVEVFELICKLEDAHLCQLDLCDIFSSCFDAFQNRCWITAINFFDQVFTHFPKRVNVLTHLGNASLEGTEFYVQADLDQTLLSVFEGKVAAVSRLGALVLSEGQTASFKAQQVPELITVIRPRNAVNWALYYPPIINWNEDDFKEGKKTDWEIMVRESIGYYWKGEIASAFSAISKVPESIDDPRFYIYRAALLLTAGQVDSAQEDISAVFRREPSNAYALALQSVIYTVQNQ